MKKIRELLPSKIDFSDYDKIEEYRDLVDNTLINIFNKNEYSIQKLEKILINTQEILKPFIDIFFETESFKKVIDLKNVFSYIKESIKNKSEKPFVNIEKYIEMCYFTGLIVGEREDDICSEDEYFLIQEQWQKDKENLGFEKHIIIDYGFNIFGEVYNFICYFGFNNNEITKSKVLNLCISQIDSILFEILWEIDDYMNNNTDKSYFINAISVIDDIL